MITTFQFKDGSSVSLNESQFLELKSFFNKKTSNQERPYKDRDIEYYKNRIIDDLKTGEMTEGLLINKYRNHRKTIHDAVAQLIIEGKINCVETFHRNNNKKSHNLSIK